MVQKAEKQFKVPSGREGRSFPGNSSVLAGQVDTEGSAPGAPHWVGRGCHSVEGEKGAQACAGMDEERGPSH